MTTAPQLEGLIDPHWTLEDLDPHTWRTIGPFIDPGRYVMAGSRDEHGLFILHDQGRVLRVFDSRSGRRDDLGSSESTRRAIWRPRCTSAMSGTGCM